MRCDGRPVGWRYESVRHGLAARGVKTAYFAKPFTGDIQELSLRNPNFRKVLYTGKHEQLVAMSIPPGGDIGNEVHPHTDQFIRIEGGKARFVFENGKQTFIAGDGGAVVVPAGTWHNVVNVSGRPLKVYTVYAPPHHPKGTVDRTKVAAAVREGRAKGKKYLMAIKKEYIDHYGIDSLPNIREANMLGESKMAEVSFMTTNRSLLEDRAELKKVFPWVNIVSPVEARLGPEPSEVRTLPNVRKQVREYTGLSDRDIDVEESDVNDELRGGK